MGKIFNSFRKTNYLCMYTIFLSKIYLDCVCLTKNCFFYKCCLQLYILFCHNDYFNHSLSNKTILESHQTWIKVLFLNMNWASRPLTPELILAPGGSSGVNSLCWNPHHLCQHHIASLGLSLLRPSVKSFLMSRSLFYKC